MLVSVVFGPVDCIIDVRVTDTDAKSNLQRPRQVLEAHEKKGEEIPRACLEQRRTFTPSWSPPMA
jgi:hypothetical protein